MGYKSLINNILLTIFEYGDSLELDRKLYIKYYSQVYSILNNIKVNEIRDFEQTIRDYLVIIVDILFCNINGNIEAYFKIYDEYLNKCSTGDKIFLYYQNIDSENEAKSNNLITYIFNNVWDEYILSKLFLNILDDINTFKNLDLEIINKISSYYKHLESLNLDLASTFKFHILNILDHNKNKEVDLDKIIEIISYYDKIIKVFGDDDSKKNIKSNINELVKLNNNIINENIHTTFSSIKCQLLNGEILFNSLNTGLYTLLNYIDTNSIETYIQILKNILTIKDTSISIEEIIKNINISSYMFKALFPRNEHILINHKSYISIFLEELLEPIKENFDNNFNMELIKFINKNIEDINLLKHVNIIINNLKNKETFVVYYKKALRSRLLNGNMSNINCESILLNILMSNNDLIDVSRMLVMLKDYQKSLVYSQEFNKLFTKNGFINLTTYDMWGITPYDVKEKLVSNEFNKSLVCLKNDFKTYYCINNESKNVQFVDNLSTCFIDFNNVELECNYLQADLLYLFNDKDKISLDDDIIKDKEDVIASLTKPKILIKKNKYLIVNEKFKYSKQKLKVSKLYKPADTKTQKSKKDNEDEDKELKFMIFRKEEYIQSYLMSFLKKNKESEYDNDTLFEKVKEKYNNKLTIDIEILNKSIEKLVEGLYVENINGKIKYLP
jgi:hypothetical protein